jgi:hypothetical protein
MELEFCIKKLADQAVILRSLLAGVSQEQASLKPDPETWSMLETLNHLYREERHDFRARLEHVARQNGFAWPPIEPPGFVEWAFDKNDPAQVLQGFLDERQKSLSWLRSLESPDWNASVEVSFVDSKRTFTAGEFLVSWVAHDLLHIRQLVELHWAQVSRAAQPYSVEYAGGW